MNNKQTAIVLYRHNANGCYGSYMPPAGPAIYGLTCAQVLDIIKSYKRFWKAQTKIEVNDNGYITFTITYTL